MSFSSGIPIVRTLGSIRHGEKLLENTFPMRLVLIRFNVIVSFRGRIDKKKNKKITIYEIYSLSNQI